MSEWCAHAQPTGTCMMMLLHSKTKEGTKALFAARCRRSAPLDLHKIIECAVQHRLQTFLKNPLVSKPSVLTCSSNTKKQLGTEILQNTHTKQFPQFSANMAVGALKRALAKILVQERNAIDHDPMGVRACQRHHVCLCFHGLRLFVQKKIVAGVRQAMLCSEKKKQLFFDSIPCTRSQNNVLPLVCILRFSFDFLPFCATVCKCKSLRKVQHGNLSVSQKSNVVDKNPVWSVGQGRKTVEWHKNLQPFLCLRKKHKIANRSTFLFLIFVC